MGHGHQNQYEHVKLARGTARADWRSHFKNSICKNTNSNVSHIGRYMSLSSLKYKLSYAKYYYVQGSVHTSDDHKKSFIYKTKYKLVNKTQVSASSCHCH